VIALCEKCIAGQHWLCQEGGCTCDSASCYDFHPQGRTRYTTNDMAPDGRVRWDHKEQTMDHAQRRTNAENEAIKVAHIEYDPSVIKAVIAVEVLEALTSRAAKYDALVASSKGIFINPDGSETDDAFKPIIVKADGATIDRIGLANRTENGDPMYQRAKKALEEIHTFRSVNVEHETDIITTNAIDGTNLATYRSGINEVTITIRGYLR